MHEQAEQLAASLPPLLVEAERLAASISLGVHGRRKSGMGESFWQFRRYAPEDPAAAIDWRQSAKSQHLFVREREWEAAQAVWFWRDGSPGMRFQSQFSDVTKMNRATVLALALASLLVRGGERIALFGRERPPSSGRTALHRLAHELTVGEPSNGLPPNLPVSRPAQFVWFSDFLSPPEAVEAAARRLSGAGASGHLIHLIDPAEEDFPFEGRTRFEAPDEKETELFGRAESVREGYRVRFRAHREAIAALARRLGWTYLAHRTDRSPNLALIALYATLGGEAAQRTA
ncbi:MAG TPA: DUF58 domain-containing protein [Rhizomicrobium sp.]